MPNFPAPDGTGLFYRDWGAGRPVVFVHGMLMNSDMWQTLLAAASSACRTASRQADYQYR
jgi:pimeloyl-ACP methyl ester carboxylesterase